VKIKVQIKTTGIFIRICQLSYKERKMVKGVKTFEIK
jgi:hypothetical protein